MGLLAFTVGSAFVAYDTLSGMAPVPQQKPVFDAATSTPEDDTPILNATTTATAVSPEQQVIVPPESSVVAASNWQGQHVYTESELLAIAGDDFANGSVPLGDGKYTTASAKKGYIYMCHVPPSGKGAQADGPWIHGSTWNFKEKQRVSGSVSWPQAVFSNIVSGITRILKGNDLPSHTTGTFPIPRTDAVSHYDGNPNSISAQSLSVSLPVAPTYSGTPHCMPTGEAGTMLTGARLFNGLDAELRDAPAHEAQDSCDGHPQESGEYHYHSLSDCIRDTSIAHVIGYADDGFPITGPTVAPQKYLTTSDLDACHGIVSEVTDEKGKTYATYHYVMTYDYPYSISCFHGKPAVTSPTDGGHGGSQQSAQSTPAQGAPASQQGSLPQQAIDACSGKSAQASCSIQTLNGTLSGTCRTPPGQMQLACVPQ